MPTEFLAQAGQTCPHTNCQLNLVYRCTMSKRPHPSHLVFPFARRAGDLPESPDTPPRFFFHDGQATYPSHSSHPAFPFTRRAGDLPESPETPPRFFFHDGHVTYLSHPRHTCHTKQWVPSLPVPSTGNQNLRVSCVLAQERAHICPRLFCDLLHYFTLFLDHQMLMSECPSSNECQMLQHLAIFIRAVGRVTTQVDSTTACQNTLTYRKLAIRLLVGKQSFVQAAPTCKSAHGLCQTLPCYKPTITPPLMRIILMSLRTFWSLSSHFAPTRRNRTTGPYTAFPRLG